MALDQVQVNNMINQAVAQQDLSNSVTRRAKNDQKGLLDGTLNAGQREDAEDNNRANAKAAAGQPDAFTPTPPEPTVGYTKPV